MSEDPPRGTGLTSRQMQEAPKGAIFIWCNAEVRYAERLARYLGRDDLIIVSPGRFEDVARGRRIPVVMDHATRYDAKLFDAIRRHEALL